MSGPTIELTGGAVAVGVGLLVGGILLWKASQVAGDAAGVAWEGVKDGASTVGGWVNPVSDQNLAYRGVNALGGALAGDDSWSLGGWIYDITHPETVEPQPDRFSSGGGGIFNGNGASGGW